jgi:hypothetical protein
MTRGIENKMNEQRQNLIINKQELVKKKNISIPMSKINDPSYSIYSQIKKNQNKLFQENHKGFYK